MPESLLPEISWTPRNLLPDEWARKAVLEGNIDRCLEHIESAQNDLVELHRTGFWQAEAPSFLEYLRKRWPKKCDRSLYRLVAKVEVIADLTAPDENGQDESPSDAANHAADLYYSEPSGRCTDVLNRLPPSMRKEAWQIVCARAAAQEKEPTPVMVQQVIDEWEQAEGAAPTTEDVTQSEKELAREEAIKRDRQAWKDWHRAAKAMRDAYPHFLDDEPRQLAQQYCVSIPDRLRRRRSS